MSSFNSTNGVISARPAKISNGGDSVLLVLLGTGEENAFGMTGKDKAGWHKWNPSKLPSLDEVLEIPCERVDIRVSEYTNDKNEKQVSNWLEFV